MRGPAAYASRLNKATKKRQLDQPMSKLLNQLTDIAHRAGDEIMRIYGDAAQSSQVDYKVDNSPLTIADRRSHEIIVEALANQFPAIPILSEEGATIEYATRKQWASFWLIDPLDGTKEFINRNGEFTVNIALVERQRPVVGVVYAPVFGKAYCGSLDAGAYCVEQGNVQVLRVNDRQSNRIAVRSKSHASPEEDAVLSKYDVADCTSIGSSLKFCLVDRKSVV